MKKNLKLAAVLLTIVMVLTLFSACGKTTDTATNTSAPTGAATSDKDTPVETGEVIKIGFVTSQAVDQAEWLQNLSKGLADYAANNSNVEIKVVEATQANEYEPKIRALADTGFNVIITAFDNMTDATLAVAKDFPNTKFGSLDGAIANLDTYVNVQEFGLNRTHTAFLAGYVAGKTTLTNKVAIVAGADVGVINQIIAGWQQGIVYANPEAEDTVVYANTFEDPTIGKELALSLYSKDCDVLGAAAGGTGVGAAQAAGETQKAFVAWDVHYPDTAGDFELGSAVNYFEKMVIAFIENTLAGEFQPGARTDYGLSEGACDFQFIENTKASPELIAEVEALKQEIIDGKINISTEMLHK